MLSVTAVAGGKEHGIFFGNWNLEWKLDRNRLLQFCACEDEQLLPVNRVKIKTIFLKSNIYFKVF